MINAIIIAVLAAILFAAARYVYRAKKNHASCIGCCAYCGHAKTGSASNCCGCHPHTNP